MKHTDNLASHLSKLVEAYSIGLDIAIGAFELTQGHDAGTISDDDFSVGMAKAACSLTILNDGIAVGPPAMARDTLARIMPNV